MDLEHRIRARACAVQDCARALAAPDWRYLEVLFDRADDGDLRAHSVAGTMGDGERVGSADADFYLFQIGASATALRDALAEASVHWDGRVLSIERSGEDVRVAVLSSAASAPLCTVDIDAPYLDGTTVFTPSLVQALADAAPAIADRQQGFAPWRDGLDASVDWDAGEIAFDDGPSRPQELVGAYLRSQSAFVWPWLTDVGGRQLDTPRLEALRQSRTLPLFVWRGPFPIGPNVVRQIAWLVSLQLDAEGVYESAQGDVVYFFAVWPG